jgi:CubicO group peptidase (beta-lactamase class C family)
MTKARLPVLLGLLLLSQSVAGAQAPTSSGTHRLSDYEGTYEYRDGATLFMISSDSELVAILNDAKYPLRETGPDAFVNPSGDPIPFVRGADGGVVAFKEHGDAFKRRSTDVPADARLLLEARSRSSAPYRYEPPRHLDDGITVAAAEPGTLSPEVAERLVNGVIHGAYPDVRSILVYQRGALRLEEYFYGYDVARSHQMRSFTKSVVALAAGVAVDRGLLPPDQPVLERLGYDKFENPDPRKAKITLIDLLSHRSGLACNDHDGSSPGNENKLYETSDWVKAFLDLPVVSDPGTTAYYCSGGIFTAGRIVERATGRPLPDFADEAIFQPLGIRRADWKWNFNLDRSQRNEFGQIYLRPRDMLKLGLLIQQRGLWNGKQVISSSWVDQAVSKQSRVDNSDYGLGIWHRWYGVKTMAGDRRVETIMLSGNGGQKVFIVPSLDLIVVFTGASFNRESPENEMMAGVLLPALLNSVVDR